MPNQAPTRCSRESSDANDDAPWHACNITWHTYVTLHGMVKESRNSIFSLVEQANCVVKELLKVKDWKAYLRQRECHPFWWDWVTVVVLSTTVANGLICLLDLDPLGEIRNFINRGWSLEQTKSKGTAKKDIVDSGNWRWTVIPKLEIATKDSRL